MGKSKSSKPKLYNKFLPSASDILNKFCASIRGAGHKEENEFKRAAVYAVYVNLHTDTKILSCLLFETSNNLTAFIQYYCGQHVSIIIKPSHLFQVKLTLSMIVPKWENFDSFVLNSSFVWLKNAGCPRFKMKRAFFFSVKVHMKPNYFSTY